MTQEFVTLPREVVEQAIEALFCTDSEEGSIAYKNELEAVKKLRAALDKPQANQPAMTPIAQRKLDDLVASGYTISGYSIYHEQKHQHGFVTGAGLVGWWKPDGVEYPQPRGEQEPDWSDSKTLPSELWKNPLLSLQERLQISDGAVQWNREVAENLRARLRAAQQPQPKREPLTDEAVLGVAKSIEIQFDSERLNEQIDDILAFARAIEAAHNIK